MSESDTQHAVRRFFGVILMVAGGLITFLSGACTLIFSGIGVVSGAQEGHIEAGLEIIPTALMVGLPGVGIGLALFFIGRAVYRRTP
jgi:hypothetical protein